MKIDNKKDLADFFIENGFDIELPDFNENIFDFNLYYKKYEQSIVAPVAHICIDYQQTIYKIFCIIKYGTDDMRRLSKEEKDRLEVVFSVKKGSSNILNILPDFKDLIETLPPNYKCFLIALLIIATTGYFSLTALLKYKENIRMKELDLKEKELDLEAKKNKNMHETIRLLIEKLLEFKAFYPFLSNALNELYFYQKSTMSNIIDMKEDVIFNSEQEKIQLLKKYRKDISALERQGEEVTKQLTDKFQLISINATTPYFVKLKNDTYGYLDVYYDSKSMPQKQAKQCGKCIVQQKNVYIEVNLNVVVRKNKIKKAFLAKIIKVSEKND